MYFRLWFVFYSLPSTGNNIIKFLTDLSFFENNMQENLSTLKGYILNSAISSYNKFCLPKSSMAAVKQLNSDKELVVTKADKVNKVFIIKLNLILCFRNLVLETL